MADIRAFRGTFYNPLVIEDLSRVIAPPYDIIDDKRKSELLSRSPFNIVRLILPQKDEDREFWNSSATLFRAWKNGEVLVVDETPSLYIYRQTFDLSAAQRVSRTGIVAGLRCENLHNGDILPHERTFPSTTEQRLNLLRACRANFSQIFMVFRDPGEEALALLEKATAGPSMLELRDDRGVEHRLWRLRDPGDVRGMTGVLSERKLIIADGHHRYETARAFSEEAIGAAAPDSASSFVSVTLFRSEDPGLSILPVHRLLQDMPIAAEEAIKRLEGFFDVEMITPDIGMREGMYGDILGSSRRPCYVMITRDGAVRLELRKGVEPSDALKGAESERWKELDISILHSLIIGDGLGLDASELAEKGELRFTPWESTALAAVREGSAEAAFIVRPTRIDEIWDVAQGGERMPHKSSYFYPKLPSGLVIYDHESAFPQTAGP